MAGCTPEVGDDTVAREVNEAACEEAAGDDEPCLEIGDIGVDEVLGGAEGEVDGEGVDECAGAEGEDVGDELFTGLEGETQPCADDDGGHRNGSQKCGNENPCCGDWFRGSFDCGEDKIHGGGWVKEIIFYINLDFQTSRKGRANGFLQGTPTFAWNKSCFQRFWVGTCSFLKSEACPTLRFFFKMQRFEHSDGVRGGGAFGEFESDCVGYDATLAQVDTGELGFIGARSVLPGPLVNKICGYAAKGKAKARVVCEAFVRGAGGLGVFQPPPSRLRSGSACFFGVTEPTRHLWHQAQREGRDWYYLDNAYFDVARGQLFRAVRCGVQASGLERPDWKRFGKLGLEIQPWRRGGRHVVLAVQSNTYMGVVAGQRLGWVEEVLTEIRRHTDRPILVRGWRSNKMALAQSLREALLDCWALVTWSSAAANEALLAGVPVFVAGQCAASQMGLSDLSRIESPIYPAGRALWAAALAGQQWSLEEFCQGVAWRALQAAV